MRVSSVQSKRYSTNITKQYKVSPFWLIKEISKECRQFCITKTNNLLRHERNLWIISVGSLQCLWIDRIKRRMKCLKSDLNYWYYWDWCHFKNVPQMRPTPKKMSLKCDLFKNIIKKGTHLSTFSLFIPMVLYLFLQRSKFLILSSIRHNYSLCKKVLD